MPPLCQTLFLCMPAVLISLLYVLKILGKKSTFTTQSTLPPGPRSWPLVGNLLSLWILLQYGGRDGQGNRKPQPLYAALGFISKSYGSLFHLRLGSQHVVVASSTAAAFDVLKTHDRILCSRHVPATFNGLLDVTENGLVLSVHCDSKWKLLRSLYQTKLFSSRSLQFGATMRKRKAQELVEFLAARGGEEVNVADLVSRTVFNMFGNTIFSRDLLSLGGGGEEEMKELLEKGQQLGQSLNLEDYFPKLFKGWDLQGLSRKAMSIHMKFYALWDRLINERVDGEAAKVVDKKDFFSILLGEGLEWGQLKGIFQEIFIAGSEATASSIEWAMSELFKNTDILSKLKEEIQALIGEKGTVVLKESHLSQLPYLEACIKETFRLHPAAALLPHRASNSCQIMGGYTIPKGSVVLVNVWAIGRDPEKWEDPLTFMPERFLVGSKRDYRGTDFDLIPFGSGRRICPGLPLATRIIPLILASLIHNFDWSLPRGKEPSEVNMEENLSLIVRRKEPLILIPSRRV